MAVYTRLNREALEIRLIRLDASTQPVVNQGDSTCMNLQTLTVPLAQAPAYFALSYVWGARDSDTFIHVDGARTSIRPNLLVALQQLQDHQVFSWLWIDALCINQNDDTERSWQVNLMRQIFLKPKWSI
jgi:hypothetical protein